MLSSSRNGPYIRDNRSSAIETAQGSDPSLSPSLPSAAAQVQLLTHVEVQRRVDQQSSSSSNISSNYSLLTLQKYVAAPIASKGQWMAIFNEKGCDDGNGDGGNSIVKEDSIFFIAHLKRIELPSSPPAKNHHHHHQQQQQQCIPRWVSWKVQLWGVDDNASDTDDSSNITDSPTNTSDETITAVTNETKKEEQEQHPLTATTTTKRLTTALVTEAINLMITDSLSFLTTTKDDCDGNEEQIDIPPPSISIGISALDQKLVPYVADAVATCSAMTSLQSSLLLGSSSVVRPSYRFRQQYSSPCGLWIIRSDDDYLHDSNRDRDANDDEKITIRTLTLQDAPLVNERWEYQSATSLAMIEQMISSTPGSSQSTPVGISSDNDDDWYADSITNTGTCSDSVSIPTSTPAATAGNCCCAGVEINGALCAWILQYLDGPLGMLWCEEPFRRRGLAKAVVLEAVDRLRNLQQQRQQRQQQQEEKDRQQRNRQGSTVGERKDWGGIDDGDSTTTTTNSSSMVAYSYIVDGNSGSEKLFRSLGWERVQSVNWIGFSLSDQACNTPCYPYSLRNLQE